MCEGKGLYAYIACRLRSRQLLFSDTHPAAYRMLHLLLYNSAYRRQQTDTDSFFNAAKKGSVFNDMVSRTE